MTGRAMAGLAHLLVLPLGLVLAVPLGFLGTFLGTPAVEVQLRDTMYVVAHVYPALLLAAWLGIASLVARRWGRFNAALVAGWAFLLGHLLAGVLLTRATQGLPGQGPGTFNLVIPPDPSMGHVYLAAAGASFLALMAGLGISFARRPRVEPVTRPRTATPLPTSRKGVP